MYLGVRPGGLAASVCVCSTVQRSFFLMGSTASTEIRSSILANDAVYCIIALKVFSSILQQ